MKHRIGTYNALFFFWVIAFSFVLPRAAFADSFAHDVMAYDVTSLGWAAVMSLFGGTLRTIFTLAADANVVASPLRELWKDVLVAVIAGTIAYIAVEALRASHYLPVPSEVRFALIVFAGWSRLSFFGWLNQMGTRVAESITQRLENSVAGGAAPAAAVPVADAPPPKPKPFGEKQ